MNLMCVWLCVLSSARQANSIPRHKYVRSCFQHDEDAVKERVASCLAELEQFSRRFGVPAKSVRLSEGNLRIVQQALHGHLEVLPTEVSSKMVECENAVNAIIEKEWVPMEKTHQEALERLKVEAGTDDTRKASWEAESLERT
ncbi:hypothetical protein GQ600_11152 [Phytophthora cactorum]|nr:hypothetical protein GQ600_11152 [Phytophthora cactorum]